MNKTTEQCVSEALEHLQALDTHLSQSDLTNETVSDAVSFRLAAAIDSLAKASPDFREHQFGEKWQLMWALRNRITHAYFFVDQEVISETVRTYVPELRDQLKDFLDSDPST